jgi:lipocalin
MDTTDMTPKTSHRKTVDKLDLQRYMGEWYEVARYENIFERGLVDVRTKYTLLPDKTVKVENRGTNLFGKIKKMFGTAFQPSAARPGHLRVSFFWWFASDYNVIMLAPDYSYSVVSGHNGKYLWILSRTKDLPGETLDTLFTFLRTRGFNPSKLIF